MARIQRRDASALSALYDRYGSRVYGLAVTIVGEGATAEEVTQDAFLRVWTHAGQYHPDPGRFLAWLLTVTRRAAIDRLRHDRRSQAAASVDDDNFPELRDVTQDDQARWRDLRLTLDQLPSEQREAILLAFYRGMSHSEISEHLGIPLGTVKTRMRLGLDRLRGLLGRAAA
jgi:RNA polymerase sigma-70 factor (ECF subfamily)